MIQRSLIVLSLCCAILCAFVGFLSHRAIEESKKVSTNSVDLDCHDFLESAPKSSTEVVLSGFFAGKRKTTIDLDGDDKWDLVGVPLFPSKKQNTKYGYKALILCCKGIPDQESFEAVFGGQPKNLTIDYWPERQDLDKFVHSGLAQEYLNLDFSKSQVAFYGFERENPIFGESTKRLSILVGGIAVAIAVVTILFAVLANLMGRLFKRKPEATPTRPPSNRAGLPAQSPGETASTGGVLDRVRSLRDKQPGV